MIIQEQFWRSVLFHNHYSFLSSSGYEIDEDAQNQSQKEQQELLMKMFAVSMNALISDLEPPDAHTHVHLLSSYSCPVNWSESFAVWSWQR